MKPIHLMFKLSRKYTRELVITTLTMLALVGVQLLVPWLVKLIIARLTGDALSADTIRFVNQVSLIALVAFLLRAVLQYARSYASHIAGHGTVSVARRYVYEHLQQLSLRYYEDKQTGQLMSRVINDTDLFERMIAHAIPDVVVSGITLVGVLIILFGMNWQLTLISMLPIPLIIFTLRAYSKLVRPAFKHRQKAVGELNAILADNLSGIREIKAFAHEELSLERVGSSIDEVFHRNLRALRLMATYSPFFDLAAGIGQLLVIFFGSRMAVQGTLAVAELVAFFLYLDSFYQPVRNLGNAFEAVQESMAGFERVADILLQKPEITNPSKSSPRPSNVKGEILLKDVSFSYNGAEPVLENINLEIPAGSSVALVGPTGVGKTTLASLLPRFYDVTRGSVSIDGIDVREWDLDHLHESISMVLQDVFLFHGSIRENILFGKPNASEEEVLRAAEIANVNEFVVNMADGYDTLIGERGVKLSGGQKQRISIARAVLKDSPILIFDEATSAVDTETEMLIQQALQRLIKGRTTIIIAHRLSTVRNVDKIVALEGNTITEMGTHAELLERKGLYYKLYTVQQKLF
ncbi:MAG: ABC transporter ATP-binding protein [Chloroflexi bacterium]|nr:ABC transporter ATP-binding protein [Chloroflexota bacterium]